ncbi:MAG: PIN domain-containing protein [Tessaracoccus sp.]|uniref:PIN domain-containing protein n=1 Tax=Tessaracoccus sp. TaxID=1971211 RepID=UPI001EBCE19D|nr:PIN domain-containing protein [Tessaracoccus sp.]MBK7822205.1 PIN domain-containing protein [Tessaracoccus sp.]
MELTDRSAALLDTSVLIALTQEGRTLDLGSYKRLYVSSVSYAELRLGVACASDAESAVSRYSALEDIVSLFGEGLPFDDHAAVEFGRILQAVVRRKGGPRAHMNDRMIAAIAASRRLPLLTLNASDLVGMESHLEVIAL